MPTLSPQAVHLWVLRDDPRREPELPEACSALLAPEEREHLAGLGRARLRREHLLARTLVRTTLSRYAPVPPAAWRFVLGPHGKPDLAGPPGAPPLRFNLSHTAGMLALAVTLDREVGVDVESTRRDVSDGRLAERFFAPSEAADVRARRGESRRERFFAYWTLKEAYLKARGTGLAIPLSGFWFDLDSAPVRVAFAPDLADEAAAWQFARLRPSGEHALALAVRRGRAAELEVVVHTLDSAAASLVP